MKTKTIKSKAEIKEPFPEMYLIDADGNENSARAMIESLKNKKFSGKIGIFGWNDSFNRRAIETLKIDYLISPEKNTGKDSLKQRDSGLNHVVVKEAVRKNIAVVIDFDDVFEIKDKKQRAIRLAKIIQNVKVCRKAGCRILIWGNADKYALQSFGFSLGMSSQQVAEAEGL